MNKADTTHLIQKQKAFLPLGKLTPLPFVCMHWQC